MKKDEAFALPHPLIVLKEICIAYAKSKISVSASLPVPT